MLASDIREHHMLKIDGKIFQVIEREISGTGKFGKTIQLKLRSVENGQMIERRFRVEEKVDRAEVDAHPMEYLYRDGNDFVFMDQTTFEQLSLPSQTVGYVADFLKENTQINVLFYENKPIHIDFPKTIDMHVRSAPAPMGSGQDNTFKEAELENGAMVLVPQFIKTGDRIRIDVEHKKYVERLLDEKEKNKLK